VAWTVGVGDVSVVSGTLVCVSDHEGDWSPGCFAFEYAGEDFNEVAFFAGGSVSALSRFPSVEEDLNVFFAEGQSCRTAVNNCSEGFSMGFAPGGDFEFISE